MASHGVPVQLAACCLVPLIVTGFAGHGSASENAPTPLPSRLSETGLYVSGSTTEVRAENMPFAPQYTKRLPSESSRLLLERPRI